MKIILILLVFGILIISGCTAPNPPIKTENHQMDHMAMEAHGGDRESVGIHMYRVYFERPAPDGGQTKLKFRVTELYSEKAVDLEVVHEKIMHVVFVRDDLKYFGHIHPEPAGNGFLEAPYRFLAPGKYRVWADFTVDGMQHLVDFDFEINGVEQAEEDSLKGIKVSMETAEDIQMGKEYQLKFMVLDTENKPVKITEKFLAANAHLIDIDQSLEEFSHNHDENFDGDNVISFSHKFKKAGNHRLWVQFSAGGQERTAPFEVGVK